MHLESIAYVVAPGKYALAGFDVKVARSVNDVGHLSGDESNLIVDGKPVVGESRKSFPVLQNVPFKFRLLSTEVFGTPFTLEDPVVK